MATVPHGHDKDPRTMAASTAAGLVASNTCDGRTNAVGFVGFIRHPLVPALRGRS